MQYAPSTGCFYPDDIAYPAGAIPGDAIETTREVFDAWCSATPGSTIEINGTELVFHPPAPPTLDQIKAAKIGDLNAVYQVAATAQLDFTTTAGATVRLSRDPSHKAMVDTAFAAGAADWTANVWIDAGNAPVTPFTFADIEALRVALAAPTEPSLLGLMTKVNAVHAASSPDAVAAITF